MHKLSAGMQQKLRYVVQHLVAGNIGQLVKEGILPSNCVEGTIEIIQRYPGRISLPPETAYESVLHLGDIPQAESDEQVWWLAFRLWYDNQVSDLVLEATYTLQTTGEDTIYINQLVV